MVTALNSTSAAPSTLAVGRLHPWNVGFTWRSPGGPFRLLRVDQAARFDRDGFVVLDELFDPGLLAEVVTAEVDRFAAEGEALLRAQDAPRAEGIAEAGAITFMTHLVTRSEVLRSFATHPLLVRLCADLVGPDVNLYWDQAVYEKPGKPRRLPWHQDNGYTFVEPQQYLTCWVALTDATVDNGCPWVVPGAHRRGTIEHRWVEPLGWQCIQDRPDAMPTPVRAGSVVVVSSLTPHMTGPNTTGDIRRAYILQYAPAGACQLLGDPHAGPPTERQPCNHPDRQLPVLRFGHAVESQGSTESSSDASE